MLQLLNILVLFWYQKMRKMAVFCEKLFKKEDLIANFFPWLKSTFLEEEIVIISLFFLCSFRNTEILSFSLMFQIPVLLSSEQLANKVSIKRKVKYFIFLIICNKY